MNAQAKLDQLRDAINANNRHWGECDDCHRERVSLVFIPWDEGMDDWEVCIRCASNECKRLLKAMGKKIGEY